MPLLERETELAVLHDRLARAQRGAGGVVLLCGEAGIGKSSVLDSVLKDCAPGFATGLGYCDPISAPAPLGPVLEALAALWAEPLSDDQTFSFGRSVERLAQAKRPVVVALEDLHWCDARTLDWITYVGRRIAQLRVLLVLTCRDTNEAMPGRLRQALAGMPSHSRDVLQLQPLSLPGVKKLSDLHDATAAKLLEYTGGNPFFVQETQKFGLGGALVPGAVLDSVAARIARLAPDQARLLDLIACCPSGIAPSVARGILGLEALPDTGFLRQAGGRLIFRHQILREAAYFVSNSAQRLRFHQEILAALAAGPPDVASLPESLHHALGARDVEAVLRMAKPAVQQASRLGAHRDAMQLLERALELAEGEAPAAQVAELKSLWALEAMLAGYISDDVIRRREEVDAYLKAKGPPFARAENLRWLARAHWFRSELEPAQYQTARAVALYRATAEPRAIAVAASLRAYQETLQGRMKNALRWGRLAAARAQACADTQLEATARITIGTAQMWLGDAAGAEALRAGQRLAEEVSDHLQAGRAYVNLAECYLELGALKEARQVIEDGIVFEARHDLDGWIPYLMGRKAQLLFLENRFDAAIAEADRALSGRPGSRLVQMPVRVFRARAKIRAKTDDAGEDLARAMAEVDRYGEPRYVVPLALAALEAAVLGRTPPRKALSALTRFSPDQFSPHQRGEFAFWCQLGGLPRQQRFTAKMSDGFARLLAGSAAGRAEAEPLRYFAALLRSEIPENRSFLSNIHARAALEFASGSTARRPAARGQYRAARAHPYGLTAREQIVLSHVLRGDPNDAIAARLKRSTRTIENQVSSILGKLNCKSRIDLLLRVQSEPGLMPGLNT